MISITQAKSIKKISSVNNGFEPVQVLSWNRKDTKYYELSPYYLKTDGNEKIQNPGGVIFENFWQGSKVYDYVNSIEVYPHFSFKGKVKYLWWEYKTKNHPEKEMHYDKKTDKIHDEWTNWRGSLWECPKGIRYPNYKWNTKNTQFSYDPERNIRYDYLSARKKIYVREYIRLIRNLKIYKELLEKLKNGDNICIVEMDVPHSSKKGIWGTLTDKEEQFYPTLKTLKKLMKDANEPFGHGLALAMALLEDM